jgi:hypothetical protein
MNLTRIDIMSDCFNCNRALEHCKNSLREKSSIWIFDEYFYNELMTETADKKSTIIGFREWISLPELEMVAIKGKIDTGAKTSSLHAFDIKVVKRAGVRWVKFKVHPIQKNNELVVSCAAPLLDKRVVTDSGGHKEMRCVIRTIIKMGPLEKEIELTLTNRGTMKYRMLIGREALKQFYIDPSQSYLLKKSQKQKLYLKDLKAKPRV